MSLKHSNLLKISNFYREKLLPKIGGIRGLTKPLLLIEKLGVERISKDLGNYYELEVNENISRKINSLDLIKKYVRLEYSLTTWLINEIGSEEVFYDVGGFNGYHAILGTLGSKVYTFEPDPENLQVLRENVELNEEFDIEIIESPLWDSHEVIKLETGKGGKSHIGPDGLKKKGDNS